MAVHTPAQQLYDLLVSRNFELELLDSTGRPSNDPGETEVFSFDFTTESGNDYGTVVIMLGDNNDLEVYFGDNVGKGMEGEDKKEWFDFLYQLRMFAKRNLMSFGLKNLNRLRYSMQGQAAIKEGLFESWTGKKDVSYNDGPNQARLMIKHKRSLGEGEARFRYVESLFIETAEQERYKLPFKNLTAGKAMLEHVRQGGRPYDMRGQHICEMVNELNVLSRFRRANHGKIFEGDTAQLVEQTDAYYETARRTLKSLSTRSGYTTYFESWNPGEITEQEVVIEGLKHLFITQTLDQRIEEALPILARIQQGTDMKEANIFEQWANKLVEGTWATPDTPEKQAQLAELLSKELPVGADAINAKEQLYDLIGDDELFDQLQALADQDADADGRDLVYDRLQELADRDPDVNAVLQAIGADSSDEEDSIGPSSDAEPDEPTMEEVKDPYTQTEDPAGTQQPEYPEYQDNLAAILKAAGVDDTVVQAAPDYEEEVTDESVDGQLPLRSDNPEPTEHFGDDEYKFNNDDEEHFGDGEYKFNNDDEEVMDEAAFGQNLPPEEVPGKEKLLKTPVTGTEKAMSKFKDLIKGMSGSKDVETFGSLKEKEDKECTCSEGACVVHEQGASCTTGNPTLEETTALQGQYGHSGKMQAVTSADPDIMDRIRMLAGVSAK